MSKVTPIRRKFDNLFKGSSGAKVVFTEDQLINITNAVLKLVEQHIKTRGYQGALDKAEDILNSSDARKLMNIADRILMLEVLDGITVENLKAF